MNNAYKKKIGTIVAIVFVLAVIVVGALTMVNRRDTTESEGSNEIRISITDEGFSPSTVTVAKGTTVVWVNDTAAPREVGSNPYPDASSFPGLRSDAIGPGESYSFTFSALGTIGYADYTNPTTSGSIQVK
jgi:plastocyanin